MVSAGGYGRVRGWPLQIPMVLDVTELLICVVMLVMVGGSAIRMYNRNNRHVENMVGVTKARDFFVGSVCEFAMG